MSRYLLLLSLFCVMASQVGHAFAIEVADAVITTAVVDREPVDSVDVFFPVKNGKLYCFTRITGADEPTSVYHVWFLDRKLMSRVELPVNSPDWRTWSVNTFMSDWSGEWRVEIQDVDGNMLHKVGFQLR